MFRRNKYIVCKVKRNNNILKILLDPTTDDSIIDLISLTKKYKYKVKKNIFDFDKHLKDNNITEFRNFLKGNVRKITFYKTE